MSKTETTQDDLLIYGVSFEKDGQRIDPQDVYIKPLEKTWLEKRNDILVDLIMDCGLGAFPVEQAVKKIKEIINAKR